MSSIILLITLAAEILTTIAVIVSIAVPQRRLWPPVRPHAWGRYFLLALFSISAGGVILLGILDWDDFIFPAWARMLVGLPLGLVGNALSIWAILALGFTNTTGEKNALICRGPYRFSRNPQYVGFIIALVGWALMTNSTSAFMASMAGILPLVMVPFAEEPWLHQRYGAAYEAYIRSVRRFI